MSDLDHLVVGLDGSQTATRALEWAIAQHPRKLTLVHGFSPGLELLAAGFQVDLDPVRRQHEERLASEWAKPAHDAGLEPECVVLEDHPANALAWVADDRRADAVVVGQRGNGSWNEHHLGDTASRLLHRCDHPVIITTEDTTAHPLKGEVVVGLSNPDDETSPELAWTLELASAHPDVRLRLVTLATPVLYQDLAYEIDMSGITDALRDRMDHLLERLRRSHPDLVVSGEVREGAPLHELAAVAEATSADLVVVGSHHPGAVRGFVAGSVARLLPPRLPCPMAAVPMPADG